MKLRKNILKEAVVLLIAAILVLTSIVTVPRVSVTGTQIVNKDEALSCELSDKKANQNLSCCLE